MKKSVIIVIVVVVILIALIGGIVSTVKESLNEDTNQGKERTPITASSFYTIMSQKGYSVQDESVAEAENTKQVYVATSEDESYTIEFYEFTDEDQAINLYKEKKATIDESITFSTSETNSEGDNYARHAISANSKYMVVSRIDNTVLYLNVKDSNKNTVKAVLDELGY